MPTLRSNPAAWVARNLHPRRPRKARYFMKAFTDYRRFVGIGGTTAVVAGFIVAALVLPMTSDPE
jgi:hypothetical protein